MGMFLKAQGKLVEAELCLREALEGRHRVLGDDHPDTLKSINEMGYVLLDQGELAEAERYFREALEIAERLRTRVIGDEHNRAAYAGKLRLRETAAVLSSLLTETNRFDRAWSVAERGRARALLDLLTRDDRNLIEQARARADKAGESAAIETLEVALTAEQSANIDLTTAEALLAGIQKQRARTEARDDLPDDEKGTRLAKLDQRIAEQHAKVKSLRRGLDEASAKVFAELRGLFPDAKPLPIEEILARLAPGELLLGYTWIGDSVQLLVAEAPGHTGTGTVSRATDESTGQGSVRGYLLAKGEDEVAELTELARNVRNLLVDRNSDASSEVIGGLLAKLIPEEIRTRVQSAERLIVLPDGPLNGIPFDALRPQSAVKSVAAGDGQLGDRPLLGHGTQIVYAASATMYLNRKGLGDSGIEGLRGKMTAVALGDPIFDRDAPPEPDYPSRVCWSAWWLRERTPTKRDCNAAMSCSAMLNRRRRTMTRWSPRWVTSYSRCRKVSARRTSVSPLRTGVTTRRTTPHSRPGRWAYTSTREVRLMHCALWHARPAATRTKLLISAQRTRCVCLEES